MNPASLLTIVFKGGTSVEVGTVKTATDIDAIINSAPNAPGGKKWRIPLLPGKERKGMKAGDIIRTVEENFTFDVADILYYSCESLEVVPNLLR